MTGVHIVLTVRPALVVDALDECETLSRGLLAVALVVETIVAVLALEDVELELLFQVQILAVLRDNSTFQAAAGLKCQTESVMQHGRHFGLCPL